MLSVSDAGVDYNHHNKYCPCKLCRKPDLGKRKPRMGVNRNNTFHGFRDCYRNRDFFNVIKSDITNSKLMEAKMKRFGRKTDSVVNTSTPLVNQNETKIPELCRNTMLYIQESVRRFDEKGFPFAPGSKCTSFSEPVPFDRLQKKTSNNIRKAQICDPYFSKCLQSPKDVHNSTVLNRQIPQSMKANQNNEDIVRYLRQFEEVSGVNFSTLPVAKSNASETSFIRGNGYRSLSAQTSASDSNTNRDRIHRLNLSIPEGQVRDTSSYYYADCSGFQSQNSVRFGSSFSSSRLSNVPDSPIPLAATEQSRDGFQYRETAWANQRGLSVDTSSALSSETDSDFSYYPGSSVLQDYYPSCTLDFTSSQICKLPSQIEDPDSPVPPYRHNYYANSLDDVTRQFYLDDDALSDDVFVDDYQNFRDGDHTSSTFYGSKSYRKYNHFVREERTLNARIEQMKVVERVETHSSAISNNLNEDIIERDPSYSSVGFERCEQYSLFPDTTQCGNTRKQSLEVIEINVVNREGEEVTRKSSSSSSTNLEKKKLLSQSEADDYELSGYNLNLANAFDSLRRNSMQSKSRKLWKERRSKMRRSNLFHNNSSINTVFPKDVILSPDANSKDVIKPIDNKESGEDDTKKHENRKIGDGSGCLPENDKEIVKRETNNGQSPPKPLRGILKNKNVVFQNLVDCCSANVSDSQLVSTWNSPEVEENVIKGDILLSPLNNHVQKGCKTSLNFTFPLDERCKNNLNKRNNNVLTRNTAEKNMALYHDQHHQDHQHHHQPYQNHQNQAQTHYISVGIQVDMSDLP